jgi:hypothetical protein
MSSLLNDIRKDENYAKFKKVYEACLAKLDLEGTYNEALNLHTSRTSRLLTGNDRYSAKRLIDAAFKDLSCRARLVELRVKNDKQLSYLVEATDKIAKYIKTEYADDLKEFSTVGERNAYIDRVLKGAQAGYCYA